MKANELRIGNWVINDAGNIQQVVSIPLEYNEFNWFKPIPLTEEWLEKFGCTKYENVECLYLTSHALSWTRIELDYDGHYNVFLRQKDEYGHEDFILLPTEIEFVHQLQNLYFALKGEELEIK